MTSRLERLFLLLETGSTPLIRKSAALQIGEVQKLHPHELDNLLNKTLKYLHASSWDTRIAASQAIEAIVSHTHLWLPSGLNISEAAIKSEPLDCTTPSTPTTSGLEDQQYRLTFSQYNVEQVLACGYALFQCGEVAQDSLTPAATAAEEKERLDAQKKNVYRSLNMTVGNQCILEMDIIQEQDLVQNSGPAFGTPAGCTKNQSTNHCDRRILESVLRQFSLPIIDYRRKLSTASEGPPPLKRLKSEPCDKNTEVFHPESATSGKWPLDWFARRLIDDLLSPGWEKRHGAATGLREILKLQGQCGGRVQSAPKGAMERLNQEWLEDLALRLITVLAVDRFGDFVGDQVVAMVRETSAQTLGLVVQLFTPERVENCVKYLLDLLKCSRWEARHGGMLGMKYLLAIRKDLIGDILPKVFEPIFNGLKDEIDDVSAVAAATLVPVKDDLMTLLPEKVPLIVSYLWDALLDLDELAACTGDLLMLLSSLLSFKGLESRDHNLNYEDCQLTNLIPRLWPFISNGSTAIRKSVLGSMLILCEKTSNQWLNKDILSEALRILFQRSLVESNDVILDKLYTVWNCLLEKGSYMTVVDATCQYIGGWLSLMMQSTKVEIVPTNHPVWFIAQRPVNTNNPDNQNLPENYLTGSLYIGGFTLGDVPEERERCATRARYQCAKLLGTLAYYLNRRDNTSVIDPKIFDEIVQEFGKALLHFLNTKFGINKMCIGWVLKEWANYKLQNELRDNDNNNQDIKNEIKNEDSVTSPPTSSPPTPTPLTALVSEYSDCHTIPALGLNKDIADKCLDIAKESIYYDELRSDFSNIQSQALDFLNILRRNKVNFADNYGEVKYFSLPQIVALTDDIRDKVLPELLAQHRSTKKPTKKMEQLIETLENQVNVLRTNADEFLKRHLSLKMGLCTAQACALISWNELPDKLSPIICPIMDTVEKENIEQLQRIAASSLVQLLRLCCERVKAGSLRANPIPKIVRNLISFASSDTTFTPEVSLKPVVINGDNGDCNGITSPPVIMIDEDENPLASGKSSSQMGILSWRNIERNMEKSRLFRRGNSTTARLKNGIGNGNVGNEDLVYCDGEVDKSKEISRRGSIIVLGEICKYFGAHLPTQIATLWSHVQNLIDLQELPAFEEGTSGLDKAKELVQSLQVLELIGPSLHPQLQARLKETFPVLAKCLESSFIAVRHMAARCFGMLSTILTGDVIDFVLKTILDMLNCSDCEIRRQGAVETIHYLIECLSLRIVPFIVFFIVPMLGRMSDQNQCVRLLATHCFAQLVQLMTLDNDKNCDVIKKSHDSVKKEEMDEKGSEVFNSFHFTPELLERKKNEKHFLEQLMNINKLDNYQLPIQVNAELRTYQQDGLNWLAFLSKYRLHGIIADEMGLGKTLQAICILASEHYLATQRYMSGESQNRPLPSIVICPPTLTGHWLYEIQKFVQPEHITAIHYTGPPVERTNLRSIIKKAFQSTPKKSSRSAKTQQPNLVIASYDLVRNDIEFFSAIRWNYCILDEGHVIKNGKTKLSKAIKSLKADHRLILTGTPIQNNVLELWSLFDFLIPGFLGTERQFLARYSKPILLSREAKSSSKEQEAGVFAMEKLHRQVLPFILRRMKEDVLKDLPPKIIQDYYCELSPLQTMLYEDFARSRAKESIGDDLDSEMTDFIEHDSKKISHSHVFQSLQYLRKVCNHPKLALTASHPRYDYFMEQLKRDNNNLSDINNAAKLCALKQLLLDCGIGNGSCGPAESCSNGKVGKGEAANQTVPVVNQHRVLIFCQLKSMLDIIENDLLRAHMKTVSYMRLDGDVPAASRFSIVHQFNNDPSIDILLLTTQVGGLGLNLTGADTVIFVEHDWNPTKDLQAMDRAHRIGQKKVVNVYRLITAKTLEEKIMGLQKFKLNIANTVISSENSNLDSMGTDQLLDLFEFRSSQNDASGAGNSKNASGGDSKKVSMKTFLENLPELWDTEHYESEYDMKNFMQSLKQ